MSEQPTARSRERLRRRAPVRHADARPVRWWRGPLRALVASVGVIGLSASIVLGYAALDLAGSAKEGVALDNELALGNLPNVAAIKGGVNLLLVGVDKRTADGYFGNPKEDGGILNDVTMLLHISQDHSSATVVSFPRDMLVPMPECKDAGPASALKINTTFLAGGLACVVSTVENLTGLSIPFAAEIEFYGVVSMSNAVGGVTVCVGKAIEDPYTNTWLQPGEHTLMGLAALQFLRTRHGVGDGSDLGRISNQQSFLTSLARKLTSEGTLSDPGKLYGLAKAALGNMTLSNSLHDINRMISIASALKGIPLDKMTFLQYPNRYVVGGGAVEPEPEGARALNAALKADKPIALSGGNGVGVVAGPTPAPTPGATPGATASATPASTGSAKPTATATPVPSATAAPGAVVVLPGSVTGTTADTVTCSKGRPLSNQ